MALAIVAILFGIVLLVWSADRFVAGAAATAHHLGMPPLLIGMVVVGFGTSAPELVVSGISAYQNNPGLALGNAYGSNISNIGLILGTTAIISPIAFDSMILRKELPILCAVTLIALLQIVDGRLSGVDAVVLLLLFALIMGWSIRQGLRQHKDALKAVMEKEVIEHDIPLKRALGVLVLGLLVLIASSRILVWGAVDLAHRFGVSDLIIGLTILAVGTSLPELASSLIAVRRNEHDIALGNVLGSNLFNTLAVVGIAGAIQPMQIAAEVLTRDWPVMALMTISLFVIGYGFRRRPGRISRFEGAGLLVAFCAYNGLLIATIATA